ncbi:uncharacterized protein BDCG_01724 [Blastomyces dermatitidis ER-3]|uniref:Uncharacterized protein n=1 Tax=Ajellomyces dermatitidis (strain ER-3 / ATCC MYA-2586) TaxID=559297 RepID=A0ABP2ES91_AJEDR|nr:uncharacterized protein BDCG_01724 [Blastomyces dermatitidis ER-3]EEQ86604.1 hypothetical protein BDCG_01724 [Blastomyces dermatitidis ER-3]
MPNDARSTVAATSSMKTDCSSIAVEIGIVTEQEHLDEIPNPHSPLPTPTAAAAQAQRLRAAAGYRVQGKANSGQATRKNRLSQPSLLAWRSPCLPDWRVIGDEESFLPGPLKRPHRLI